MSYFVSLDISSKKGIQIKINQMLDRILVLESIAFPFSEFALPDEKAKEREVKRSILGLIYFDLYYGKLAIWKLTDIPCPTGAGRKIAYSETAMFDLGDGKKKEIEGFHNIDMSDVSSNNRRFGMVLKEEGEALADAALSRYIVKNWKKKHIEKLYTDNKAALDALMDVFLYSLLVDGTPVGDRKHYLNKRYRQKTLEELTMIPAKNIAERKWKFSAPDPGNYKQIPEEIVKQIKLLSTDYNINIEGEA